MVLHDKHGNFCVIFLLKALSFCTRGYNWTCAWTLDVCHSHAAEWPTVETNGFKHGDPLLSAAFYWIWWCVVFVVVFLGCVVFGVFFLPCSVPEDSLGMGQSCGVEAVLEGACSSPCPHGHLRYFAVCIWVWAVALLAGIDAAGESLTPARVTSLPLFCFPALLCSRLELAQCLCKAAVTKPKSGDVAGLGCEGTLSFCLPGTSMSCHVLLLCLGEQPGQTAPFIPLHCHVGKKIGNDSYCRFPSLLTRAWQGDGTGCYSQAWISWPSSSGGKTQREGYWSLLHPASLSIKVSWVLFLCLIWNVCRFWCRKKNNEEQQLLHPEGNGISIPTLQLTYWDEVGAKYKLQCQHKCFGNVPYCL